MNELQKQAATESMIKWLEHPHELGKRPKAIECVDEFELHKMHYYIFRYKKSIFGKWLLGVCGGYEGEDLNHCGHIFSEMEVYDSATAKEKSIKMIETIRKYWMDMATEIEKGNEVIYSDFSDWMDKHLSKDWPNEIVAVNFNLYEGAEPTYQKYHVEMIGCGMFDEHNSDWACDEIFTTRDDLFFIPRTNEIAYYEQGLSFAASLVKKYLHEGKYADKLKRYVAVGIGFVGGDIEILHHTE